MITNGTEALKFIKNNQDDPFRIEENIDKTLLQLLEDSNQIIIESYPIKNIHDEIITTQKSYKLSSAGLEILKVRSLT